jgi:hypothetical protein
MSQICTTLHRAIFDAERVGSALSQISISDVAAWELAGEMVLMQCIPGQSAADFYQGMKTGGAIFMGRRIVVAS